MAKPDPHRFDDLFREFGPVALRRFFGGEGIYAGDVMIGMVFGDIVYFKTDAETVKAFKAEKAKAFSFHKGKELVVTTWFSLPDRLYDDAEDLANWARDALRIAGAAPAAVKKARKAAARPSPRKEQRQRKRAISRTPR